MMLHFWIVQPRIGVYIRQIESRTKAGTIELQSWCKRVVDFSGEPIISIGIVVKNFSATTAYLRYNIELKTAYNPKRVYPYASKNRTQYGIIFLTVMCQNYSFKFLYFSSMTLL
jgi:hypothetical protein